jgi:cell division septation protein DedD
MRDLERWKDKVELSLDGRQIFFLFFGSAVAVCLIFVAGVLIGKRLEARALALAPPPVEDPLAALDQLGEADDADDSLTYHKALTREPLARERTAKELPPSAVAAKLSDAKQADVKPSDAKPSDAKQGDAKQADAKQGDAKQADVKQADAKQADVKQADAKQADAKQADVKQADVKQADVKQADAVELPRLPKAPQLIPAGKPQVVAAVAAAQAKKADGHFTLQLSAFPERSDAEEFMRKIQSAGYKPFLVVSEIPGKGVFYRVRVGDYATRDAATNAKSEFERKQRMVAYVAKL